MKAKNCLIFGGTGQIGTSLLRKLAKNNYKVTVITRNQHKKGNFIKTQANAGYIDIIELNPFDPNQLSPYFEKADICINLVGILFEKGKNNFQNIHVEFPSMLASLCKKYKIKQFIHISAMGIDEIKNSKYAISKFEGEKIIKSTFPSSTILRPSVVYSISDNFTTTFMTLLNRLPVFPIYYEGKTKFMPIHCSELTDIILNVVKNDIKSEIIECGGPEEISFKEILTILMELTQKKRILLPVPLVFGNFLAKIMELTPKPLLTRDQLKLLKFDNVYSGNLKTNITIGMPSKKKFKDEVKKYCYMWREGGQFSTEKYSNNIKV